MPRKAASPLKVAPLQLVVAEIITDPAELAAVDRMRKRLRKPRHRGQVKHPRSKTREE